MPVTAWSITLKSVANPVKSSFAKFYVGKHVTVENVHPKYENGILSFSVPKEEAKPVEEKKNYISIEG